MHATQSQRTHTRVTNCPLSLFSKKEESGSFAISPLPLSESDLSPPLNGPRLLCLFMRRFLSRNATREEGGGARGERSPGSLRRRREGGVNPQAGGLDQHPSLSGQASDYEDEGGKREREKKRNNLDLNFCSHCPASGEFSSRPRQTKMVSSGGGGDGMGWEGMGEQQQDDV